MTQCLRPGGILIAIDGEVPILSHLGTPLQPAFGDASYPEIKGWMARIMYEARANMTSRGGHALTNAAHTITSALISSGRLGAPTVRTMDIPLGPWPIGRTPAETQWIRELGEMMRLNAYEFIKSLRPTLKSQGLNEVMVERLLRGAEKGESLLLRLNSDVVGVY